MLQMTFLSEMFAAEKKKIKKITISTSYFESESIDGVYTSLFSFIFHEATEVMEEMEKSRYSWDYENFGFTKCNCLNCSLANCMDKI